MWIEAKPKGKQQSTMQNPKESVLEAKGSWQVRSTEQTATKAEAERKRHIAACVLQKKLRDAKVQLIVLRRLAFSFSFLSFALVLQLDLDLKVVISHFHGTPAWQFHDQALVNNRFRLCGTRIEQHLNGFGGLGQVLEDGPLVF